MVNRGRAGQVMVEAAGTLSVLFLVLGCIYYVFLMAVDKIRSLDTVYHLARARQVEASSSDSLIVRQCFPGRRWLPPQTHSQNTISGPPIREITFQFLPHTFGRRPALPWKSTMRFTVPDITRMDRSWPKAPADPSAAPVELAVEAAAVKIRLKAGHNPALDAAEDGRETWYAERG